MESTSLIGYIDTSNDLYFTCYNNYEEDNLDIFISSRRNVGNWNVFAHENTEPG